MRKLKCGALLSSEGDARYMAYNASGIRIGVILGAFGQYQAQTGRGDFVGNAISLDQAAQLLLDHKKHHDVKSVTDALQKLADEFMEGKTAMKVLRNGLNPSPDLVKRVVASYGVNFRDLSHVYQDMLNRARSAD